MVTAVGPPFSRTRDGAPGFLDRLFAEAFARLGVGITITRLPAERALMNTNAGIDDGDLFRVAGLEARYSGLVRVPESYYQAEFVVIARKDTPPIDGWSALKGRAVGFLNGLKIAEQRLSGIATTVEVDTIGQLFQMLQRARVDYIIIERQVGLRNLRRRRLEKTHHVQDHVLIRPDIYVYLNVRHADLAGPLADVLREMKASGAYDAIVRASFPAARGGR
ncbi:transporter substrate-binding domain-containing protein [Breoghania sp. L-A4]|uniref:substrate-binding periplasmic protein n=1 Tax=Breoghania sp. L-A4 TaxID=2304600 RepID=UPI0013C30332|nr:transporter substrate-binding domain-containing protein [Breoghania sp. L-A4]